VEGKSKRVKLVEPSRERRGLTTQPRKWGGEAAASLAANSNARILSRAKYRVLVMLKMEGESDLATLSKGLSISQMAVYKQIRDLEAKGLVEHRVWRRGGVGRPRLVFKPSARSSEVYPNSYKELATAALEFLERKEGRKAVVRLLGELQRKTLADIAGTVGSGRFEERVRKFVSARNSRGCMVDVRRNSDHELKLVEHNCPIAAVATRYPEVCRVESRIMSRILRAHVRASSANPGGSRPCEFLVMPGVPSHSAPNNRGAI
jgi:predicted ArsR family transcriptional regulator